MRKSEEPATCVTICRPQEVPADLFKSQCFSPSGRNASGQSVRRAERLWRILNPGLWVTPGAFGFSKTKSKSCGSSRKRQTKLWDFLTQWECWWHYLPNLNTENEALYGGGWLLGWRGGCGGAVLAEDPVYTAVSHWSVCLSLQSWLEILTFLSGLKKLQTLPKRDQTRFNVSDSVFLRLII